MASAKVIVTGHRALDIKLATLPLKLQRKLARSALRKAGKLIQGKAKANLQTLVGKTSKKLATGKESKVEKVAGTGELKRGIRVRASKRSRKRVGIFISTTERAGTRWPYGGAQFEFGKEKQKARPFLRPAGYESEAQVRQFVITDIGTELVKMGMHGW